MSDYRVNLDIFAGPLDLLLYLVRKDEVDIYDIPIAQITDQYIKYIELLKSLDIDLAGDFLVMAATLIQIKSAMLLPKADTEQLGSDNLSDPRTELIRQLLEYKKFKDAANMLCDAADEQKERFARPAAIIAQLQPDSEPQIDLEQVSIWDLLEAFDAIVKATGTNIDISSIKDDTPIDLYQIEILHRLQTEGPMSFEKIFELRNSRIAMMGLFLALLELIRDKLVWAEQPATLASIYLKALTDEPAEQAVQNTIIASTLENNNNEKPVAQTQQHQTPPIPIVELAAKDNQPVPVDISQQNTTHIPIAELPPKTDSQVLSEVSADEEFDLTKDQ